MGLNPDGSYTRPNNWVDDRDNGLNIMAVRHDESDDAIAAALSLGLYKDGRSVPTQNLPMGGKRLTGLGAPVDPNDSVHKQYVDDAISPGYSNIGDYLTTLRAPGSNWLKRNGQTILQSAYTALFALIGHTFGRPSGFAALSPNPHSSTVNCIASGAGKLVIGLNSGAVKVSTNNAVSWSASPIATGLAGTINSVCFGNSIWVAVDSTGGIATAADPAGPWTVQTSGSSEPFYAVAFGNGKFIAVGATASNVGIYISSDAASWAPKAITSFTATLRGVAHGNGVWIAVGDGGVSVMSRDDGTNWIVSNCGTTANMKGIAFGRGKFVAVGAKVISTTVNGNSWKPQGSPTDLLAIASSPSGFAAVSYSYSTSSTDGEGWSTHTTTAQLLNCVVYGADAYYAADANGLGSKSTASYNVVTEFQIPDDGTDIDYVKAL